MWDAHSLRRYFTEDDAHRSLRHVVDSDDVSVDGKARLDTLCDDRHRSYHTGIVCLTQRHWDLSSSNIKRVSVIARNECRIREVVGLRNFSREFQFIGIKKKQTVIVTVMMMMMLQKAYDAHLQLAMMEFVSAAPPHSKLRVIDDFNTGLYTHTHTHTHRDRQTHTHMHTHTHTHACANPYPHTNTPTHTCTYTCTYTHTHTHSSLLTAHNHF